MRKHPIEHPAHGAAIVGIDALDDEELGHSGGRACGLFAGHAGAPVKRNPAACGSRRGLGSASERSKPRRKQASALCDHVQAGTAVPKIKSFAWCFRASHRRATCSRVAVGERMLVDKRRVRRFSQPAPDGQKPDQSLGPSRWQMRRLRPAHVGCEMRCKYGTQLKTKQLFRHHMAVARCATPLTKPIRLRNCKAERGD